MPVIRGSLESSIEAVRSAVISEKDLQSNFRLMFAKYGVIGIKK